MAAEIRRWGGIGSYAVVLAIALGVVVVCVGSGRVALGHHSYVSKYNPKKIVTLRGVVGSVSYYNPHIFFDFVATSKSGTTTWRVETESIPKARARGLSPKHLKQGASAIITGWMARDKTAAIGLKSIKFKSGRSVIMRNSPR